jgi:hypothetical protein
MSRRRVSARTTLSFAAMSAVLALLGGVPGGARASITSNASPAVARDSRRSPHAEFRRCHPDRDRVPPGCARHGEGGLTVIAPDITDLTSVVLEGAASPSAGITVFGGALPASGIAGTDGSFAIEVSLRGGVKNTLTVAATAGRKRRSTTVVTVKQFSPSANGVLQGTVVDVNTRVAIANAKIAYARTSAVTDAAGRFRLAGIPDGTVAANVTAPGYLGGFATTSVIGGAAADVAVSLQKMEPPITLTAKGGSFAGAGWTVSVPHNAVRRDTPFQVTQLFYTGVNGVYGLPLVDLSPSGLHFDRPVTVSFDGLPADIDTSTVQLLGVNPDTGSIKDLGAHLSDGHFAADLSVLDGMGFYLMPLPPAVDVAVAGPDVPCTPYLSGWYARAVDEQLKATVVPVMNALGSDASMLWRTYLQGGPADPTRINLTDPRTLSEFGSEPATEGAEMDVMSAMRSKLPSICVVDSAASSDISVVARPVDLRCHRGRSANQVRQLPERAGGHRWRCRCVERDD